MSLCYYKHYVYNSINTMSTVVVYNVADIVYKHEWI